MYHTRTRSALYTAIVVIASAFWTLRAFPNPDAPATESSKAGEHDDSVKIENSSTSKMNAKTCFNNLLESQGTTVDIRYRYTDAFTKKSTVSDISQVVIGPKNFNGKKAILTETETTIVQDGTTGVSTGETYGSIKDSKKELTAFGGVGESFVDGVSQGTSKTTFTPGLLFRYDLAPGESYTQRQTLKVVTRTAQGNSRSSSKQKIRTKYLGTEFIKVPAGRFEACKFKVTTTSSELGFDFKVNQTVWYGVDHGIQLKDKIAKVGTLVLLSAKINGEKI